jgi:hypothetical protein
MDNKTSCAVRAVCTLCRKNTHTLLVKALGHSLVPCTTDVNSSRNAYVRQNKPASSLLITGKLKAVCVQKLTLLCDGGSD